MKKIFLFIAVFSANIMSAQTIGDMHNEVLGEIIRIDEATTIQTNEELFQKIKTLVNQKYNLEVPISNFDAVKSKFNLNKDVPFAQAIIQNVENGGYSLNFANFVVEVHNTLMQQEKRYTMAEITTIINNAKANYTFTGQDADQLAVFEDVLPKSYDFWSKLDNGEFRGGVVSTVFSWVATGVGDALGAAAFFATGPGGMVAGGVTISVIVRCCWFGCGVRTSGC
jgi:hypothetical protein